MHYCETMSKNGRKVRDPIAHEKPSTTQIKCLFPPCTTKVQVPGPPEGVTPGSPQHMKSLGGIPMCAKHAEMLNFYVWCQQAIKLEAQRTPSGLVLPGNKQFEAVAKATPQKGG